MKENQKEGMYHIEDFDPKEVENSNILTESRNSYWTRKAPDMDNLPPELLKDGLKIYFY